MSYFLSKTFSTHDSEGDNIEHGFIFEDVEFETLEELAHEILSEARVEPSSSIIDKHIYYSTVDPEIDLYTAERTFYGYHPEGLNKDEAKQLAIILGVKP